jgi:hypothetical protein
VTQHQKIEKHITGLIWVFEFIRLLNLEVSNSSNQFSKAFLITQKDKIGPQQPRFNLVHMASSLVTRHSRLSNAIFNYVKHIFDFRSLALVELQTRFSSFDIQIRKRKFPPPPPGHPQIKEN